ncbi:6459_t:CDS:1, partial [Acaulospora colombiana]
KLYRKYREWVENKSSRDNRLCLEITQLTNEVNSTTERIKTPFLETEETPTNSSIMHEHLSRIKELWSEERRLTTAIIKKIKRENIQK